MMGHWVRGMGTDRKTGDIGDVRKQKKRETDGQKR